MGFGAGTPGGRMSARELYSGFDGFLARNQVRELLFERSGRINREQYWFAWLCWLVVNVVFLVVFVVLSWLPYLVLVLGGVVVLVELNSCIAVGIKRLHDRGKSGWWLLLLFGVPAAITVVQMFAVRSVVLTAAWWAIVVWMIIELGCLPGSAGTNAYGPEPQGGGAQPLVPGA